MFGRATITLGIGPHSSCLCCLSKNYLYNVFVSCRSLHFVHSFVELLACKIFTFLGNVNSRSLFAVARPSVVCLPVSL